MSCSRGTVGEVLPGAVPFTRQVLAVGDLPRTRTKLMLILADPQQALRHAALPVAGVGLVRQEFIVANHLGVHPLAALHPERVDALAREELARRSRGYASPAAWFEAKLAEGLGTIAHACSRRAT
ncbi:MAG: hypothetical protein U0168_26650 [Nannocystaceae bacterium]